MNIENYPKISIIVPIYEVEQYMNRCVSSIVNQTYKNLEIILVDDGSTDNCPDMCDKWKQRDSRIKVIHKKNGGLSDARNEGVKIATGELIGFVDSDDWIFDEMYQLLYEDMKRNGSDISACGVEIIWENNESELLTPKGHYLLNQQEAMEAIIRETKLKQPVVYKLYKLDLIRGIMFPKGKYHEDIFWSYRVIGKAHKVSIFDTPCYFYFQRGNSIMRSTYSLKRLDSLEAKLERLEFLEKSFPDLIGIAKWDLWFSCMYSMQLAMKYLSLQDYRIARKKIFDIVNEIKFLSCITNVSAKEKGWFLLSKISFERTCRLRNILKVGF